jgi:hypothetical protein
MSAGLIGGIMPEGHFLSRRAIVRSLAVAPLATIGTVEAKGNSTKLLTLGRQFDDAAAQIDYGIEHGSDIADNFLDRLGAISGEIEETPATMIEEFRVKARAACWALLGDLNSGDQSTTDKRMALSIVRDLIRLYDPDLERPGALKKLVEEI